MKNLINYHVKIEKTPDYHGHISAKEYVAIG